MTLQVTSLASATGPGRRPLALALLPILLPVAGPVLHKAGRAAPAGRFSQPLYLLLSSSHRAGPSPNLSIGTYSLLFSRVGFE